MRILRFVRCFSFALLMLALAAPSFAGVSVSVTIAPTRAARLRAAALPRRRLYLDARLLGLRPRGLLLGARDLVLTPLRRPALDARLLGMA